MTPKEMRSKLESILPDIENCDPTAHNYGLVYSHVAGLLQEALKLAQQLKEKKLSQELWWELFAFSLVAMLEPVEEHSGYALVPQLTFERREGERDPAWMPPEALAYFKKRLEKTKNPVLRARYSDLLWDRRGDSGASPKDSADFGRMACREYIEVASAARSAPTARLLVIHSLDRATSVALELNDSGTMTKVVGAVAETVAVWVSSSQFKHVGTLAKTLLRVRGTRRGKKLIADVQLEELVRMFTPVIGLPRTYDEILTARYHLEILSEIHSALGDTAKATHDKEEMASTWVAQVELMEPAKFMEAAWLEQAEKLYSEARNMQKVGELQKRIRKANRETMVRGEYGTMSIPVQIPEKELEKEWSRYLAPRELHESLKRIATDDRLVPLLAEMKKGAEKDADGSPLLDLIPVQIARGDRTVSETNNASRKAKHRSYQQMHFHTKKLVHFVVSPVLRRLRQDKALSTQTLVGYLKEWGQITEETVSLIEAGLDRYFADDPVSAIFILVPLLERVARELLTEAEIPVQIPHAGGYQVLWLGRLIENESAAKEFFGPVVFDYLRFVLLDEAAGGMNIRNDVAHGLLERKDCTQRTADLVLFLHLLMTRYTPKAADNREGQ